MNLPTNVRRYTCTYLGLLALLAVTVACHLTPLGPYALPVALAIAAAKAGLVLAVFMHLWRGYRLNRIYATIAGFWLFLLFGLTLVDVVIRG